MDDNSARSASFGLVALLPNFLAFTLLGSLKYLLGNSLDKNLDLDFPNERHLNLRENPLHRDLAGI